MKSFLFVASLLALAGCAFEHQKEGGGGPGGSAGGALGGPVSFSRVEQAVTGPRCLGCHSAAGGNRGGVNLEGYENVLAQLSRVEQTALRVKSMPPGQPLNEEEARLLETWLQQGATRSGSASAGPKGPLNWQAMQETIFTRSCFECHSSPNPEGNLDLTSLTEVRAKIGKIFERAVITQDMPMPPFAHLTVEEKESLAQWIARGMPE